MTPRYQEARLVKSSRTRATFIARFTELTTLRTYGRTCADEDKYRYREMKELGLAEVARNSNLAHKSFTDIGRGPVLICERHTLKRAPSYQRVGRRRAPASRTSKLRGPACAQTKQHTKESAPVPRTGKLAPRVVRASF